MRLDDLRKGLKKQQEKVEEFFYRRVMLRMIVEEDEMGRVIASMKDEARRKDHGRGITDEMRNPMLASMNSRLVKHIAHDKGLRVRFIGRDRCSQKSKLEDMR